MRDFMYMVSLMRVLGSVDSGYVRQMARCFVEERVPRYRHITIDTAKHALNADGMNTEMPAAEPDQARWEPTKVKT